MASPNPEGNEKKNLTRDERDRATKEKHARPTAGLYDNPGQSTCIASDSKEHRAAEERYWKKQVCWQAVGVIATILAFGAAAVYACFAHQQVGEMRRATAAAQESVDALRSSYRPWVGIYGPVALELPLTDPMWRPLTFNVQNSGQSPALNVAVRMDLKLGHGTMQPINIKLPNGQIQKSVTNAKYISPPTLEDCKSTPPAGYGSISYFPKNSYQTGLSIIRPPISPAERQDVRQGFQGFYLFGCIDYDDDNGCHHQTNVCMKLDNRPGIATMRVFTFCPTGNTTKEGPCIPKRSPRSHQ